MRTLVVSDLHLGARGDRSVLTDPGCLRALCGAVAVADRLVLLGDVVELRERPLREALSVARPALEAIGAALVDGAEVVLLAGNHDHRLIAPWLASRDRGEALGADALVDAGVGGSLDRLTGWLGAGRTTCSYPGAWLGGEVWATHGHYSDRHTTVPIFERLAAGINARVLREGRGGPVSAEDYEAVLAPMYAWIEAVAEHAGSGSPTKPDRGGSEGAWRMLTATGPGSRSPRHRALRAGFPLLLAVLNRGLHVGPLSADLSRAALRVGPLEAIAEVVRRLGVDAEVVVFGHTHRAGPLLGDDPAEWRTPAGAALLNTGCWVRETSLLGPDPARSPYRAGFVAWIDSDPERAPELINLLD